MQQSAIVGNPPIHKSLSGKLVATDLGRKWSPFQLTMVERAQMYQGIRATGDVFLCRKWQCPEHARRRIRKRLRSGSRVTIQMTTTALSRLTTSLTDSQGSAPRRRTAITARWRDW